MKNLKFKKLLVPFSFNSCYDNSFKVAEEIALRSGASVTLLNVIKHAEVACEDYVVSCTMPFGSYSSILEERERAMANYISNSRLPKNRILIKAEIGNYDLRIINLSENDSYDLIIVPDFYKTKIEKMFADINPLEIMEKTKIPVIAVNRNYSQFKLKRIVLPIRNVPNWFHKIPFVISLASLTGAKIFIIGLANSNSKTVINKIEEKINTCKRYLNRCQLSYEIERSYNANDSTFDILSLAKYQNVDLIAVSPPVEYNKLKSYLNSYLYNKLISKGSIPVLGITLS